MKQNILISSAIILFSTYSHAGCVGPVVNGECLSGADVYSFNSGSNSTSGYESNSGNRYQYDLSSPGDDIRYSTDFGAQRRDKMSTNPGRSLDIMSGEFGGGIYDD